MMSLDPGGTPIAGWFMSGNIHGWLMDDLGMVKMDSLGS